MIELMDVGKSFGGRTILNGFNLTIQSGERVVLFGRSGSGKTTVLRLIAGLTVPDMGIVAINGATASRDGQILVPPEGRGLGYVFQDLALWPHMTVLENVEFPLKAKGVPARERQTRIREVLALVGLEAFGERFPANLSGGEQQRVAICRALVGRPETVLMDEPLASLDEELRGSLCEHVVRLHRRLGFALVYVTHNRGEALAVGDRIVDLSSRD